MVAAIFSDFFITGKIAATKLKAAERMCDMVRKDSLSDEQLLLAYSVELETLKGRPPTKNRQKRRKIIEEKLLPRLQNQIMANSV
ncbi:MAG: hypothetical protein NT012_00610 [Candidatus Nealsonbacteria bacterium]|nr:hypothetical protein [Candidatus Nealsonbacteria bacterium]